VIAHLIRWSVRNRFFVVLGMLALVGAGLWAVRSTPIDALPDLSDVQVPHFLSGSGAADRREPDHLSAHHHHAVGARRQDGARL
jgi:Cu/Ag efflux pump CusA